MGDEWLDVIHDAAVYLYRKYYTARERASFESGRWNAPNPESRLGFESTEDLEAELWIFALRTGLFEKLKKLPAEDQERYLRKSLKNAIKEAVRIGNNRQKIIDREMRLLHPLGRLFVWELAGSMRYDDLYAKMEWVANEQDGYSEAEDPGDPPPLFTAESYERAEIERNMESFQEISA